MLTKKISSLVIIALLSVQVSSVNATRGNLAGAAGIGTLGAVVAPFILFNKIASIKQGNLAELSVILLSASSFLATTAVSYKILEYADELMYNKSKKEAELPDPTTDTQPTETPLVGK
jgi:hypothetical protein